MPRKFFAAAFVLLACAAPLSATAEPAEWGPPSVAYRLTMTFADDSGRSTEIRFYYTPNRQRLDYIRAGQSLVTVVDKVSKRIFSMNPSRKLYQQVEYKPISFSFNVTGKDAQRKKVGEETLNGTKVTKYNVESKTPYGDTYAGFAWISDQRIVLRLDGAVTRRGETKRIRMASKDLTVGDLPDTIFTLPSGYKELKPNR